MAEKTELQQVGRLAMRHEGDFWVAYYALPDTMEGALLLGSIHMGAVVGHSKRKEAFLGICRDMVGDILQDKFAVRPVWKEPTTAPEHERSGHG